MLIGIGKVWSVGHRGINWSPYYSDQEKTANYFVYEQFVSMGMKQAGDSRRAPFLPNKQSGVPFFALANPAIWQSLISLAIA